MPRISKEKVLTVLQSEGIERAHDIYTSKGAVHNEENIVKDIVLSLYKRGNISTKQIDFVRSLIDRINKRDEIEKIRAKEKELAKPCPNGRHTIIGKVLCIKDTYFQLCRYAKSVCIPKMMVKSEDGYTLWGSVPTYFRDNESVEGAKHLAVGNVIQFDATLYPSPDDPKHGFYKRPSKSKIILLKPKKG